MKFITLLKQLREERNITQRQIAHELSVDVAMYNRFEKGERQIKREMVLKIAKFYNVSENELLKIWLADHVYTFLSEEEMASEIIHMVSEDLQSNNDTIMTKSIDNIKKTGATFTPSELAYFLSNKIIEYSGAIIHDNISILDPACGDGALLSALASRINLPGIKFIGYDTDENYLEKAYKILERFISYENLQLSKADFLTICPNVTNLFVDNQQYEFADIVIANPPYVRTQVLGAARAHELAKNFNLSGRIDLYYPFLMAMTNALKKGGIIGVITSNRFISTKSGSDIRKFLLDNYEVLEVIDLGDTKLFNAAVLPAIFIGKKKACKQKKEQKQARYSSIYEKKCDNKSIAAVHCNSIFDVFNNNKSGIYNVNDVCYEFKTGLLKTSDDKTKVWQMLCDDDEAWLKSIEDNTSFIIKDKFKVRVGIKSCADNIFISNLWESEGYKIEDDLLQPMISQENIDTWNIDHNTMNQVIYPHYYKDGKRRVYDISLYPQAYSYLSAHKAQLESRTYLIKAKREWYELWVPQNPLLWKMPKIVFPDISVKPRFCYDDSGAIVNGNCYWMCAQTKEEQKLLLLIEGVCNSDLMTKYHDAKFTNKLYSGRRRYLTQYIEQYPIPDPQTNTANQIVSLVEKLNLTSDTNEKQMLESEVNNLVKKAFGIRD